MWEEKEVKYLKENYKRFTNKELGEFLDRTSISVEKKLNRLGLKKGWSVEEIKYLKKKYNNTSNKELSLYFNRSIDSISLKGNRLGLIKDVNLINQNNRFIKLSKYKYQCEICKDFGSNSIRGISIHLSKKHKDVNHSEYYKNNIGDITKCHFCKEDGKFIDLINGYRNLCESKECLSKSRNTQSIEYLLKQGYSENESILKLKELNDIRAIKSNKSTKLNLLKNPNYMKEKSPNCKEFYTKRGYSENESKKLSSGVILNMQQISRKNRAENPENYPHTYTTKIEYYLNKGYTREESYNMLKDRQTTFSKEICIEKYGETEGVKVWLDRQEKWHKNYKKSNFSKISQELYQSIWDLIKDNIEQECVYFATLNDKKEIASDGKNNEYRLKLNESFILPDFFISDRKKIIEFDGTYYHRNNPENKKREIRRDKNIKDGGYYVLHISESEYKQNKENTIQKCITFLLEVI